MGSVISCDYNTDGASFSSPPYLKEAPKTVVGWRYLHLQPSHVITFKLQMQQKDVIITGSVPQRYTFVLLYMACLRFHCPIFIIPV